MATWEEIFTSNSPSGVGRVINVVAGAAAIGSDASPYTSNSPSGTGRAINVNIVSGGAGAGVLQLQNNAPLDTTLRSVTDQANTVSPLQLSTTQVAVVSADGGGLIFKSLGATTGAIYRYGDTPNFNNWKFASDTITTYLNTPVAFQYFIGGSNQIATLTNTGLVIGTTTASARLHVRGDGTNPIARFENSAASNTIVVDSNATRLTWNSDFYVETLSGNTNLVNNTNNTFIIKSGTSTFLTSISMLAPAVSSVNYGIYLLSREHSATSGTVSSFGHSGFFGAAAGSANYSHQRFLYTLNNSGAQSGTATGIYLNATETALNGMTHNLMDLQVGGVSKFLATRTGNLTIGGGYGAASSSYIGWVSRSLMYSYVNGNITLLNQAETAFSLLQFGGTTNAFPAIKRNGAAIDFRFADDSGYSGITSASLNIYQISGGANQIVFGDQTLTNRFSQYLSGSTMYLYNYTTALNAYAISSNGSFNFGNVTAVASARVQIDSTTQGFLPPRMTTTQKNAISSPAQGLEVFDTTLAKKCVYNGSAWETVTSV